MKKFLLCVLLLLSFLTACGKNSEEELKHEKYKYIYQTISDNDQFMDGDFNNKLKKYDIEVTMSAQDNGYAYYVNIDNPQIAMYEITVMAIENNTEYELADKMMPNIGILDGEIYNMVPFQSDPEKGYYKGIVISGETQDKIINLKIRVAYKDYLLVNETKDYFSITVDYDSLFPTIVEIPAEEPASENNE